MPNRKSKALDNFKADLTHGLQALRDTQRRVRELRASGMKDAEIRKVMLALGFEQITPDEFLSAETVEDFVRLLDQRKRHA